MAKSSLSKQHKLIRDIVQVSERNAYIIVYVD